MNELAPPHATDIADLCERWHVDTHQGLTAKQATDRLAEYGPNALEAAPHEPWWARLWAQFQSLLIGILFAAAVIAGLLGDWVDTLAILAIVVLNGLLGFFQESRAEQALNALQRLSSPQARVLRDGRLRVIPAQEVVPGDRMEVEAGDQIPADARLIQAFNLQVQEASLTGESTAVDKRADCRLPADAPLGDRANMLFAGTMVTVGKGAAIVTATGMRTEIGKIAGLLQQTDREVTPLQRRLHELGRVLVFACLLIVSVIFAVRMLQGGKLDEVLLTSVSLAVAAVPEGLPAVVTIALAIGLQRMAQRNALIRRLPSVETLGCVTLICSDKTGTLTRNEMTVRELWTALGDHHVSGDGYDALGTLEPTLQGELADRIARVSAWCNNARWEWQSEQNAAEVAGDPTEIALLVLAHKIDPRAIAARHQFADPLVFENPFDSDRKIMSQVYRLADGPYLMLAKGAPEELLARCDCIDMEEGSQPLDDPLRRSILEVNSRMAGQALRVLALANRPADSDPEDWHRESGFCLLALVGMIDPPRSEAWPAVEKCRKAGIRPVMITGDHPQTALAIARKLRIAGAEESAVSGQELQLLDQEQRQAALRSRNVFARVTAHDKLQLVRAGQLEGHVVAMTGDGVNDAPAVKTADIGIVMGITGSDAAKAAADMVLLDDNFASIVNAVEEGRGIFENIQKFLFFLLSCNASEVLFMFLAALIGWPSPLLPLQILWINLVTDSLPALALALERPDHDLMDRPPRPLRAPVLSWQRGVLISLNGLLLSMVALFGFWWIYRGGSGQLVMARTVAFTVITLAQLFFSIGCRSFRHTMPSLGMFTNPALIGALLITTLLQLTVLYWTPAAKVLQVAALPAAHWPLIIGLAIIPVSALEIAKLVVAIRLPKAGRPLLEE